MKLDSTFLVLTLAVVVSLGISACDKATASSTDGSMSAHRSISSQLWSRCLSMTQTEPITPVEENPRAPWPATTDSVNLGIYNAFGYLIDQRSFALPADLFERGNPPYTPWSGLYPDGRHVSTGFYLFYYILRDSTGAIVGQDSLCYGWRSSGS